MSDRRDSDLLNVWLHDYPPGTSFVHFPEARFWTARRGAGGYRNYFRLADPFLDFLLILNRNDVLHLKPFPQGKSGSCSAVEVALRARISA